MAYRVDFSVELGRRARQLHLEAVAAGQGDSFLLGVADLTARLAANPHSVGDLKYHTPMGFPVHTAMSGPASINFVIYESLQAVAITKIERFGSS